MARRFLGITVLTDFILNEGIEGVLDNVQGRAGADAVACNPTVTAEGDATNGSWQPPEDAGASVRLFDRPLWGKRELWVRSGPSFQPNERLYQRSSYLPRRANDLTGQFGGVVDGFLSAAQSRGVGVFLQVGAVQPPGLREEDCPRLPTGALPKNRLAATGSLASAAIRSYNRAYCRDLVERYPAISGLRLDWPEYPCYQLDEAFQDFGAPVAAWAASHGFDFERIRSDVERFYRHLLGGVTNRELAEFAERDAGRFASTRLLLRFPGVMDWLRLKAALSTDLLRDWRAALTEAGGGAMELSANAFMPPYSLITGMDFAGAASSCGSISAKLYTMHWALMVRFWGGVILDANPGLEEPLLVRALVNLMDLSDGECPSSLAAFEYPPPDQPHPIPNGPQQRKLTQMQAAVGGQARCFALVHGYGPLDDFRRRLQLVADSSVDGVWINRYGYLNDEKLDAIREIWH